MIRVFFSLGRISGVSSPSYDWELVSSRSVRLRLLNSLLVPILALLSDGGIELVAFDQIPLTYCRLDDSISHFNKTSRLESHDGFQT